MAQERVRKECLVTEDYLNRFGDAVMQCLMEGTAHATANEGVYRMTREALADALGEKFTGYVAKSTPDAFVSNNADPFNVEVMMSYLALISSKPPLPRLLQSEYEVELRQEMTKDPKALERLGKDIAQLLENEADQAVISNYLRRIAQLPENTEHTFQDSVNIITVNTGALKAMQHKLNLPPGDHHSVA